MWANGALCGDLDDQESGGNHEQLAMTMLGLPRDARMHGRIAGCCGWVAGQGGFGGWVRGCLNLMFEVMSATMDDCHYPCYVAS